MEKPNVILINCDDMGYGDLGCYGSTVNKTACIDRLAKEGVKFTSCYAASPVCSPSRASMLTGNYPAVTGINRVLFPGEPYGLNESSYTIGNLFKDNGYRTKLVGKWHCGDQGKFLPLQFGFDEYYGLPYSNDMGIQLRKNKSINYPPLPLMEDDEVIEEQPDQRSLTERYVEQCTRFIRTNRRKPFFLYLAHMHVHLPLFSNLRFEKESQNGEFGAAMAEIDWACECILLELKKQKIYENTLIIFTSDNGSHSTHGASNFPCRGGKHFTWEGGIRIPCIMHWKGKLREDTISDQIIS